MEGISYIKSIILENKYRLGITYILFTLEMLGNLLKPYFLGEAVNDLLRGGYQMLFVFLGVHLFWLIVGTLRMLYDTRTYTQIYNKLITQFLAKQKSKENVSKMSALSTLSREYTDFLEFDLIYILEAVYNIIGSLFLIYFYDKQVIVVCVILLFPVMLVSRFYGRKMSELTEKKNDELEKQVEVIATFDPSVIKTHYDLLRKWQIKISDQQAISFGIMETFVMVLLGVALILSTKYNAQTLNAGEIIGFYFYILRFTTGLDTIPYITEKYATLKDITERIKSYEDESE
jgi:ABC-type multidrug transport system fused ATPase/permease subunit